MSLLQNLHHRSSQRHPLSTRPNIITRILDISATDELSAGGEDGAADAELGVWAVGGVFGGGGEGGEGGEL